VNINCSKSTSNSPIITNIASLRVFFPSYLLRDVSKGKTQPKLKSPHDK